MATRVVVIRPCNDVAIVVVAEFKASFRRASVNEQMKELVAMGASAAANCHPCMDYHLTKGDELGMEREEVKPCVATI